ncbi:MAG TPA: PAS domain S-box protein [Bryobacteraceae bacterium]|jgi:PAS domain S-box-containing protein
MSTYRQLMEIPDGAPGMISPREPIQPRYSFRDLIDALPVAIYTTDAEGRITHFNRAAVELSGRVPELGTDQWCVTWKLWRPDGTRLPHAECPMAVALKENRAIRGAEIIAERPNGERRLVLPYPTPLHDANGRLVGGVNMLIDITEQQRAGEAQARLAAIVSSSDDAIVSKTLDGVITSWNPGAEKIFGYTAAEAVGKTIYLIIPPERRSEEDGILARLRRGEKIDHFETERMAKDGHRIWISLTVSPVRDSSGRIIGASKVARDISQQKLAQERLREAQKLETVAQLAGGVAQEFNNLLTVIIGNVELALQILPTPHPVKPLLTAAVDSGETAAQLTRQMLAYAGKGQFVEDFVDLSDLVRKVSGRIRSSLPQTVEVLLELEKSLPPIQGDPAQLEDLVENLVANAAEAIGEDARGVVHLKTSLQKTDKNDFSGAPGQQKIPSRCVVLEVRDNGCGIDEQVRTKIFDPFFTTKFPGRGLGLAAVSGIVRSQGGAIKVASKPGEGSTFRIFFPAVTGHKAAARSE